MKKMKIVIILLLMTLGATAVSAQNNAPVEPCRDNIWVEISDLGNLPHYGTVQVDFINSNPAISWSGDDAFNIPSGGSYEKPFRGNLNNENWSLVRVRVRLGSNLSNTYVAEYYGVQQNVHFTASDFQLLITIPVEDPGNNPPQYAP